MAETINYKRVKFKRGAQEKFIRDCNNKLKLTHDKLAKKLNISPRTLTDWKREKFLLPQQVTTQLTELSGVRSPKAKKVVDRYWYTQVGARKGGKALIKKYGRVCRDEKTRLKKWREWWERKGKYKEHMIDNEPLPIHEPKKSVELAEFVGIVLGDGGMTNYQLTVTLHDKSEKQYTVFVKRLIKKLFKVQPRVHHRKKESVFCIVVSRVKIIKFCTEKLGLRNGNKIKQQVDIPGWVKKKREYMIACIRGLVDTDGCVFTHKYKVNGSWYSYKKISFASASKPLLKSVQQFFQEQGFYARINGNHDVRIENREYVKRYFKIFGTHNSKHLMRYRE